MMVISSPKNAQILLFSQAKNVGGAAPKVLGMGASSQKRTEHIVFEKGLLQLAWGTR